MSSKKLQNDFVIQKTMGFNKSFSFNSGNRRKKDKNTGIFSTIGVLLNIIWILSLLLNPPINPQEFILIGGLALIMTFIVKIYTRLMTSPELLELQGGGSIVGYVITWVIVQFYSNKGATVTIFGNTPTVDQVLGYYLIIAFLIWFFIPSSPASSQELVFNLPPLVSYFLLNMWKLIIILLFLVRLWNFNGVTGIITALLLIVCIIETIGMYQRIFKLDITDIILDITQIFTEIIKGPLVSVKWTLLLVALILFDFIKSDLLVLGVLGFSMLMSIVSFTTFISRLTIDSGLIQRKSNEVQKIVPQIFTDIKEIQVDDFHDNYFQVVKPFELKRDAKVKRYFTGDILFKIPLKQTLESLSGIFVAKLTFERKESTRHKSKTQKNSKDVQIKSVGKFKLDEWNNLLKSGSISNFPSESVIEQIGFSSKEEFDANLEKKLKDFSKVQDNVRDRIRGVPATFSDGEIYTLDTLTNGIQLSDDIMKNLKNSGVTKLEVIPGKDEYLFYVKKKTN